MNRRNKIAAVWVGLQLLFFVGWVSMENARQAEGVGRSVLVRTVPVDPRDFLRGQFIQLAYEFSNTNFSNAPISGDAGATAWVVLAPDAELHSPRRLLLDRPTSLSVDEVALRGNFDRWGRITYGIERYFVPESTETPKAKDLTVRLRSGASARAGPTKFLDAHTVPLGDLAAAQTRSLQPPRSAGRREPPMDAHRTLSGTEDHRLGR